jgi:RNA recognition motif. (a.k.a. RRM, RBD, or RNP domain)
VEITVSKIDLSITKQILRKEFVAFGQVKSLTITNTPTTTYALVDMPIRKEGCRAIVSLNGELIGHCRIKVEESASRSDDIEAGAILDEIRKWKVDSSFEEVKRYFYSFQGLETITNGEKAFVIGRKGTGKTAILETIYNQNEPNLFIEKLSFKDFPLHLLYSLSDHQFPQPNQFISLWTFITYMHICRMMVKNNAIEVSIRGLLEKFVGGDEPNKNFQRALSNWTAKEFGVDLFGFGGKLGLTERTSLDYGKSWIDKIEIVEELISQNLDNSSYFILFDDLDEFSNENEYMALITSLIKAIYNIRKTFWGKLNIYPIIFLRDDIYELIKDSDKNKWSDFKYDLIWDETSLKKMLAYRLSRALKNDEAPYSFEHIWPKIFSRELLPTGSSDYAIHVTPFEYITRMSYLRPRDYIEYLKLCAVDAHALHTNIITADIIKRARGSFSIHLKDELVDEMQLIIPDIREILSGICTRYGLNYFNYRDIYNYLNETMNDTSTKQNPEFIIKYLFKYSVIGHKEQNHEVCFNYMNKYSSLDYAKPLSIHEGLLGAE